MLLFRVLVRLWLNRGRPAVFAGFRWQLLCALRSLARGAVLIVQADPLTMERRVVVFEGQSVPQVVGATLLTRHWVQPLRPHWMADSMFYRLSPAGAQALAAGLRWWKSLPLHRRLILRLTE